MSIGDNLVFQFVYFVITATIFCVSSGLLKRPVWLSCLQAVVHDLPPLNGRLISWPSVKSTFTGGLLTGLFPIVPFPKPQGPWAVVQVTVSKDHGSQTLVVSPSIHRMLFRYTHLRAGDLVAKL